MSPEEPRATTASLQLLADSILDYAIFALELDGRVANWNAGAERIKGYRAEEIIGLHFGVFYTPEARAAGHPEWVLDQAARHGRHEEEGWRVRKDGTRFWANILVSALRAPDGEVVGFGKVTRDLTERKGAEDSLQDALYRLQESQVEVARQQGLAAIGQLAAAVSHELRNPLGVITNALYLMRGRIEALGDEGLLRPLGVAEREVNSATLIVSELLDYARNRTPQLTSVGVADLVEEALSGTPAPTGVEVTRSVARGLVFAVDRDQLRQVLVNLIMNSYQACRPGDSITVGARATSDQMIELSVSDTGSGMSATAQARAFEPFFTDKAEGTGLGLAVVQRIIDAHRGKIRIDSELGRGTTVIVALPSGPTE